jgi:hypothetical protein
MLSSRLCAPVAALALLSSIACSSVSAPGVPTGDRAPGNDRAAALTPPVVPATALVSGQHSAARQPEPGSSELDSAGAPRRARPLEVLGQVLTSQAMLVSLLLAPLSKDGGELARLDTTPDASSTRLR